MAASGMYDKREGETLRDYLYVAMKGEGCVKREREREKERGRERELP